MQIIFEKFNLEFINPMLKNILITFCIPLSLLAQIPPFDSIKANPNKKNEININVYQVVFPRRISFSYERFLKKNTSVALEPILFEELGFDKSRHSYPNIESHSLKLKYIFYVNPNKNHYGFAFYPLLKYTTSFKNFPSILINEQNKKISNLSLGNGFYWKRIYKERIGFQLGADIYIVAFSRKFLYNDYKFNNTLNFSSNLNFRF
ncbi:hypothetical protein EGI22_10345 [Lacihabitans sp. LS3-19]|uniref:hypothetical protein n=1 Tax=Lacihabitans sp. LS3-19 TaxID=2487335 RepID=UPI0020CE5648|nr:hypothetical protein [Lacihabitans sp. LS3-19]MCP9768313.1 hypothetical protein [Lacihabitans sp. LS3-19]